MEASISLLTTIVGLGLAAFALLPREKIYNLRLYVSRTDYIFSIVVFFLIHYIAFFPILEAIGMPSLGKWAFGFDQQNSIYMICFFWAFYIAFKIYRDVIPKENEGEFCKLIEELLFKESFEEIINLAGNHSSLLFRENILPTTNKVFTNTKFVKFLSYRNPYIVLEILHDFDNNSPWKAEKFVQMYVENLVKEDNSIFYHEVNEFGGMFYGGIRGPNFQFSEQCKFLRYFLDDPRTAEKHIIYKPIGDTVIEILRKDESLNRSYNSWDRDFIERHQFSCPVHTAVRFFDMMIIQSMHKGISWHMWLYYFDHFVKEMIDRLSPNEDVNLESEFPTIFHYLIYDLVDTNLNWISEYQYIDNRDRIGWANTQLSHDNRSIPKSAALNLGLVMHRVLNSDKFTNRFKRYLLEIVIRRIRDFRQLQHMEILSGITVKSVINGGYRYEPDLDYIDTLYEICNSMEIEMVINNFGFFQESLDEFSRTIGR